MEPLGVPRWEGARALAWFEQDASGTPCKEEGGSQVIGAETMIALAGEQCGGWGDRRLYTAAHPHTGISITKWPGQCGNLLLCASDSNSQPELLFLCLSMIFDHL